MATRKRILIFNWNNILTNVARKLIEDGYEVDVRGGNPKVDNWETYDIIVIWNCTNLGGWMDFAKMVKAKKKRLVLVQFHINIIS